MISREMAMCRAVLENNRLLPLFARFKIALVLERRAWKRFVVYTRWILIFSWK